MPTKVSQADIAVTTLEVPHIQIPSSKRVDYLQSLGLKEQIPEAWASIGTFVKLGNWFSLLSCVIVQIETELFIGYATSI